MNTSLWKSVLMLMCLLGFGQARAEFKATAPNDGGNAVAYASRAAGASYDKAEASVVWAFNSEKEYATAVEASPEGVFSQTSFDPGDNTVIGTSSTTVCPNVNFVRLRSKNGGSDIMKWTVKPAKGLTFAPMSVSFYISRNGTDGSENAVTVKGEVGTTNEVFGSITPHRNNKTKADDKLGSAATYTTLYEYTLTAAQQAALTSGDGFSLVINNGYGNTKDVMVSDVHINGTVSGTVEAVEKYTLKAVAAPAEGASIAVYPDLAEYEAGTSVKLTATPKFGYNFVNWTDAKGNVVSEAAEFTHTVNANVELTANVKAVATYELKYGVDGGANSYMVQPNPAPTVVDGKNMYEEGTKVTLTALGNEIFTFNNWSDGQSSSEITVTMDGDKEYIGAFSAKDFVAAWDFYLKGAQGRVADFYSEGNDAAALVLRDADGKSEGWLDKSEEAAGGYEGRPAAVNWREAGLGTFYWQTTVNAEAFTDLKVKGGMTFNYNAYTTYNVEVSLDEETWTKLGSVTIPGSKSWVDYEFALPASCNNQPKVSLRWIADTSSEIMGTNSKNDGIALGAFYIFGSPKLVDDGVAPVLVSTVPEEGNANASINGRIVLNFDEKVKVAEGTKATLGSMQLTPAVTGKTVTFSYKNLAYATDYTFTLAAGSVMDLTDNKLDKAITIKFTTKNRPAVDKALFDAEVSTVDELVDAIAAAHKRTDETTRFRIFIHNGTYKLPASTEKTKNGSDGKAYPDPTTYINTPNVSFIGESMNGVVITNTVPNVEADNGFGPANVLEGIGNGDVMRLEKKATECYFQNLTMKSSMGDSRGRDIVLNDNSDKTIFKDACLWGYQDTYVSNNDKSRFYFEGGLLRGRTDFLCGKGDVYYNAVTLQMCETGGYIAVPSVPKTYGYVFKDCEIVGEKSGIDGKFTLGRPWGSGTPIAVFIDTKMTVKPSAAGWNEMSGGWPKRFAEYNSYTAAGTVIDLKDRKKMFGEKKVDGVTVPADKPNNPVLTKEEADSYNYYAVMGADDDWDPASVAEQAPAPANVKISADGYLTWDKNDYAMVWAVCRDGKVIDFTTEPVYAVAARANDEAVYSVRAANEMGGLGEAVEAVKTQSGIVEVAADEVVSSVYYNLQGQRVAANTPGVLVRVDTLSTGETKTTKVVVK